MAQFPEQSLSLLQSRPPTEAVHPVRHLSLCKSRPPNPQAEAAGLLRECQPLSLLRAVVEHQTRQILLSEAA